VQSFNKRIPYSFSRCKSGWKHEIRSHRMRGAWTFFRNCFSKFWKITMGALYIKKSFKFWNNLYTFKVATTKFSWKFTMFQEFFYMFKALNKSMWITGFLFWKFSFLIKYSPNHFNFFVNFSIFHKKGSICLKYSKNKNTYTLLGFDTQTFLTTIIILNLCSWSKVKL